jgi:uncharacterized membrane protein
MTGESWWKSKRYWIRGGIIGFGISVLATLVVILSFHTKCIEAPSCSDYIAFFQKVFIVFGPIGTLIGVVIGFVTDRIKSKSSY